MASTLVASFARVRAKAGRACTCCLPAKHGKCSNRATLSHYSASTTAMVLSNPLPGATTRPPDTQQLPPSQPIIQQLQASIETVACHAKIVPGENCTGRYIFGYQICTAPVYFWSPKVYRPCQKCTAPVQFW